MIGPVLAQGRAAFERRMRGTCRITRPGPVVTDPDTGEVTHPDTAIYEGRCYIRYPGLAFEQNPEVGTAVFTVSRVVVRIPFGPIVRPGDAITVLTDPDNPQMVGTKLRVASMDDQSQATAQRILAEDFQSGGG